MAIIEIKQFHKWQFLTPQQGSDELCVVAVLVVEQPAGRVHVDLDLVALHKLHQDVLANHCATLKKKGLKMTAIDAFLQHQKTARR